MCSLTTCLGDAIPVAACGGATADDPVLFRFKRRVSLPAKTFVPACRHRAVARQGAVESYDRPPGALPMSGAATQSPTQKQAWRPAASRVPRWRSDLLRAVSIGRFADRLATERVCRYAPGPSAATSIGSYDKVKGPPCRNR